MAPVAPELGAIELELGGEGQERNGGGEEMFLLRAELRLVVVREESDRPGLFIGR